MPNRIITFVEIPQREIEKNSEYGRWLVDVVERKWMTEFNHGNEDDWTPVFVFNTEERRIRGYFGNSWQSSKFFCYDGNVSFFSRDFIASRGFEITDHHEIPGVARKIKLIADNLERFLKQEKIEYRRKDI